jgi:hypothetical protein
LSTQNDILKKIQEKEQSLSNDWFNYWKEFSYFDTWQFWVQVLLFISPLIFLYIKIDRRRILQFGFYGLNVHLWLNYLDRFATNQGYWEYPYQMLIFIPNSFVLDASLIPVTFILVYQWTVNNHKNYFLYSFLLCVFHAFVFIPLSNYMGMFKFFEGTNYFHLFGGYLLIMIISKIITDIFLRLQKESISK